jgi:hypothetical protein
MGPLDMADLSQEFFWHGPLEDGSTQCKQTF